MSFPRYKNYKHSGVEWLGEVPESWKISRLGFESWVRARLGWRGLKAEEYVDDGFIFLSTPNIKFREIDFDNVNYITEERFAESPEIQLRKGDVLLAKDGSTLGTVNVVRSLSRGATVNSSIAVITPNTTTDGVYLHYLFKSKFMDDTVQRIKGGMGVPHLFQEDLRKFYVPVPPMSEQRQIASFLDEETEKIECLIEEQQRLIELLKEKRQAVISHAVTKGLNPDAPMKDCGVDWIGLIPQHWEVSKLGQTANIVRGGSPRPAGDSRFFNGDFMPWITVGEVTKDDGMYLAATESMLTEVGAEQSRTIDSGTLVLTNSGATLGVPKILGITGCANDGILAFLDLKANANKKYLYFVLGSLTSELRERMKQGSGQPNLNTGIVSAIQVPLPPVVEQLAIVAELERMQDEFGALMAQAETSVTLLQERRSALISAAVTGKIDVRKYIPKEAA